MPRPKVPIVIKRYANWRLYDTGTAAYMSLEHLAGMARQGKDFVVRDSPGEDITRSVVALITSPTTTEH